MFKIVNAELPMTDVEIKHFCSHFLSESNRMTKRIKMKSEAKNSNPHLHMYKEVKYKYTNPAVKKKLSFSSFFSNN